MTDTELDGEGELKKIGSPRLDALEKLYVRTYLSTLSHLDAYRAVRPDLKHYKTDNPYALRENIKFHIALSLQEQAESLALTPSKIIERLYKEATREGAGSNHAARIQALTLLGKHLGLFQERKEESVGNVFNIISYSSGVPTKIEEIKKERVEEVKIDSNIYLTSYGDKDDNCL